jgi:hypothetical protein
MVAYIDQNSFADIWRYYVQGHNIFPAILLIFVSVFFTRRPRAGCVAKNWSRDEEMVRQ